MSVYKFLNELLTDIEDLQNSLNRIRENIKTKIKEAKEQ